MKKIVIFGVGEFADVAHVYFTADRAFDVAAFTVHAERVESATHRGLPVAPFEQVARDYPPHEYGMFVAIGFRRLNRARREVFEAARSLGYELVSYVNSRSVQWGEVAIGHNCFVFENNVLQPFVHIGHDVILWSGNHVGHHARIGDHCFIASHAVISGGATIGAGSFIGVNATIGDHVRVAEECVIGAGALVLCDTERGGVYAPRSTERSRVSSSRLARL